MDEDAYCQAATDDPDGFVARLKASRSVDGRDGRGLDRLADQCGKDFQGGCLLYDGWSVLPIGGSRHTAVPLRMLWEM